MEDPSRGPAYRKDPNEYAEEEERVHGHQRRRPLPPPKPVPPHTPGFYVPPRRLVMPPLDMEKIKEQIRYKEERQADPPAPPEQQSEP